MAHSVFSVKEHVLPTQYVREYPGATLVHQEDELQIHLKQYTPKGRHGLRPGAVTIIGAHANGFPKELYEPFWEELYHKLKGQGQDVQSIWIADVAHQGVSGVLNEHKLGNDPGWFDHPRDLLHMINHFRKEMPRPLMGIGHSMGGNNLVNLSLIHPRLLSGLVLIEPTFGGAKGRPEPSDPESAGLRPAYQSARSSTFRRDLWRSRDEAATSFKQSKFYQTWDPRVLDLWVEHGLRDIPTAMYPKPDTKAFGNPLPVTLTTTKSQEVHTFVRPNYTNPFNPSGEVVVDRDRVPDLHPEAQDIYPFYRPEYTITFDQIPHLRPPALYVFGGRSHLYPAENQQALVKRTGTGVSGSGGSLEGKVMGTVLPKRGHLIPMEKPGEVAEATAGWLTHNLRSWWEQETNWQEEWAKLSTAEKTTLTPEWEKMVGGDPRGERTAKEKL